MSVIRIGSGLNGERCDLISPFTKGKNHHYHQKKEFPLMILRWCHCYCTQMGKKQPIHTRTITTRNNNVHSLSSSPRRSNVCVVVVVAIQKLSLLMIKVPLCVCVGFAVYREYRYHQCMPYQSFGPTSSPCFFFSFSSLSCWLSNY